MHVDTIKPGTTAYRLTSHQKKGGEPQAWNIHETVEPWHMSQQWYVLHPAVYRLSTGHDKL